MEDCVGHGRQRPAVRELRDLEHVDAPPEYCETGGDAFALGFIEAPLKVVKVKAKLFLMWGDNPVPGQFNENTSRSEDDKRMYI